MDIFNRTPSISEDTVQYTLYPPSGQSDRASVTTFAACIQTFVESLLPDFLWHRDAFELKVVSDPDSDGWVLEGRVRVGDCVDDEWGIVWLLKEISAKWDVVISVFDSDGEFLLIEAAETLPAWVQPTNSENRVWIFGSRLHLIPISHVSPPSRKRRRRQLSGAKDEGEYMEEDEFIAAHDALELVRDSAVITLAPPEVEQTVWQRISRYPSSLRQHVHLTKASLPLDVAKALSVNPSLVQKAIETFYTRDAIQLGAVHRMARFPPEPHVLRMVRVTRTAYAQLVAQIFYPPKVFGRWQEAEGTPEWRWRDVGMKIASGFEILYQESKGRRDAFTTEADGTKSSAEARKEALRRNPDYVKYIQNLVTANYFKGEQEGSQLWTALEDKAAALFIEVRREDDATRQSFATLVTAAISQAPNTLVNSTTEVEDSDDWLNIDAEDFDNMLEKTMGTSNSQNQKHSDSDTMDVDKIDGQGTSEDHIANEQASKLQKLAKQVEEFVEGEGDLEGARFKDEEFSDEEFSDEDFSDDDDDATDDSVRQAALDKLVPAIEPSEYGKMPASFHSNSQKVTPVTMETGLEQVGLDNESAPRFKPVRKPILPRNDFDGVDSDDETDEEATGGDEEDEEEQPQVVGEMEVDMEDEEEEFLEFSRQALGITDEQWNDILRDRKGRGAFIPASAMSEKDERPIQKSTKVEKAASLLERESKLRTSAPGPRPNANPDLDSFEAVMKAMDAELARGKLQGKTASAVHDKGKTKVKAISEEDEEQDIEAAMDAELKAVLDGGDEEEDGDEEEPVDYNLIKNFLESFKSQAGLSGPVSNLAGRLQPGWKLPRDDI